MGMSYSRALIENAKQNKCDICCGRITNSEAEGKLFQYSKTKRKSEVYVHTMCFENLYKKG